MLLQLRLWNIHGPGTDSQAMEMAGGRLHGGTRGTVMSSIGPQFIATVADLFTQGGRVLDNTIEGGLKPLKSADLDDGSGSRAQMIDYDRMVRSPTTFDDAQSLPVFRHLGGNMFGNTID